MKIDEQIEMLGVMRIMNKAEARVWKKRKSPDTAYVMKRCAMTCTAAIASLKRLKRLGKDAKDSVEKEYKGGTQGRGIVGE